MDGEEAEGWLMRHLVVPSTLLYPDSHEGEMEKATQLTTENGQVTVTNTVNGSKVQTRNEGRHSTQDRKKHGKRGGVIRRKCRRVKLSSAKR